MSLEDVIQAIHVSKKCVALEKDLVSELASSIRAEIHCVVSCALEIHKDLSIRLLSGLAARSSIIGTKRGEVHPH